MYQIVFMIHDTGIKSLNLGRRLERFDKTVDDSGNSAICGCPTFGKNHLADCLGQ